MNLIINLIKEKFPNWNQVQLTEDDFYEFSEANEILVIETPLRYGVKAMLWFVENEYVLTVNSKMDNISKLFGMWHEVGHFTFHCPNKTVGSYFWGDEKIYKGRKQENEADFFALVALIPTDWVKEKSFNDLLNEGFTDKMIWKRKKIYEAYKI